MNLRWCVLTGALMLASVAATYMHQDAVQNPPGVTTRWWDGSISTVEKRWHNGQLSSRTTYGDDGTTVLTAQEWSPEGALLLSKERRKDGKVEIKNYSEDGKILLQHSVWVGDESYFVARRDYYETGELQSETLMTEDGRVPSDAVMYNKDGSIMQEMHVLSNAAQETKMYDNKVLISRSLFEGNGDMTSDTFYQGTELLRQRSKRIRLNSNSELTFYDKAGLPLYFRSRGIDTRVDATYDHGKINLRQSWVKQNMIVEEFWPGTEVVRRKIEVDEGGAVVAVSSYRQDGTLAVSKSIKNGAVVRQVDYDAAGTAVVKTSSSGESETIAPASLRLIVAPRLED